MLGDESQRSPSVWQSSQHVLVCKRSDTIDHDLERGDVDVEHDGSQPLCDRSSRRLEPEPAILVRCRTGILKIKAPVFAGQNVTQTSGGRRHLNITAQRRRITYRQVVDACTRR